MNYISTTTENCSLFMKTFYGGFSSITANKERTRGHGMYRISLRIFTGETRKYKISFVSVSLSKRHDEDKVISKIEFPCVA